MNLSAAACCARKKCGGVQALRSNLYYASGAYSNIWSAKYLQVLKRVLEVALILACGVVDGYWVGAAG